MVSLTAYSKRKVEFCDRLCCDEIDPSELPQMVMRLLRMDRHVGTGRMNALVIDPKVLPENGEEHGKLLERICIELKLAFTSL